MKETKIREKQYPFGGASAKVVPRDALYYDEFLRSPAPSVLAADLKEQPVNSFTLPPANPKTEKRAYVNAEKYSDLSSLKEDFFEDLYFGFSAKNEKKEMKNRLKKRSSGRAGKVLFAIFFPLAVLLLQAGAYVAAYHFTENTVFQVLAFLLPLTLGLLLPLCLRAVKGKKSDAAARLLKPLRKKPKIAKTLVLSHLERIEPACRIELFRVISAGLKFCPLRTLVLCRGEAVSDFADYFGLTPVPAVIAPKVETPPQSIPAQPQESMIAQEQPAADISECGESAPAAPHASPAFDFSAATIKEIIEGMRSGKFATLPCETVFDGAMSRLVRVQEKNLQEYVTLLSYTIEKTDLTQIDFAALDAKAVAKLLHWYASENKRDALLPLYDTALKQNRFELGAAFIPFQCEEEEQSSAKYLQEKLDEAFVDNVSPAAVQPFMLALLAKNNKYFSVPLTYAKRFAQLTSTLPEKEIFLPGFLELFCAAAPLCAQSDVESVYAFVTVLLKAASTSESVSSAMKLIAAYKDKFRYLGLAIDTLNDIIFGKEFSSIDSRLKYIDNLLSLADLAPEEKTRYINYLLDSKDMVQPRHRATVLCSLLKGGAQITRENIFEAAAEYQNEKTEEYLDEVTTLFKEFLQANKKDDRLLLDLCYQNFDPVAKGMLLTKYMDKNPLQSVKLQKQLLAACMGSEREDMELSVLYALSPKCQNAKFPKDEFIAAVCDMFTRKTTQQSFSEFIALLIRLYHEISLSGDQKHDFKSAMFKSAAALECDLSIDTTAALVVFKIEYISFTEQKIAKQGDADVARFAEELIHSLI